MYRVPLLWIALTAAAGCEVLPPENDPLSGPTTSSFDAGVAVNAAPPQASDAQAAAIPDAAAPPADAAAPTQMDAGSSQGVAFAASCSFTSWPAPDAPVAYHSCALPPASGCNCNGTSVSAPPTDAVGCLQTLASACGVDPNARTGCEHGYGGGCWPSAAGDDAWLCTCQATGQRAELRASSCRAAGEVLCKPAPQPCEDHTGRCKPDGAGKFNCECPFDAPAIHSVSTDRCLAALRTACVAGIADAGSGGECSTPGFMLQTPPAGACSGQGREPQDGFECSCDLGTGNLRQGKVVAPSCDAALHYFCPEAASL